MTCAEASVGAWKCSQDFVVVAGLPQALSEQNGRGASRRLIHSDRDVDAAFPPSRDQKSG